MQVQFHSCWKIIPKCPFNLKVSDTTKHRYLRMKTALFKTRVMDEQSLAVRAHWAWLQNRSEELRRSSSILDKNGQMLYYETSIIHEEVHQRPWRGFPFLYSFSDCAQMPAVLQKPMYDKLI